MSATINDNLVLADFQPKYWLVWIGIISWYGLSQLPYRFLKVLSWLTANLVWSLQLKRVKVIQKNIDLCFANLSTKQRHNLARQSTYRTILAFFETGAMRSRPLWWLLPRVSIKNSQLIDEAFNQNKGIVLVSAHFNYLDFGLLLGKKYPNATIYRRHKNPLFEKMQRRARLRFLKHHQLENTANWMIERSQVRAMLTVLKNGCILNIAPDQDFSGGHKYAPFMGMTAKTATSPSKFAIKSNAKVLMMQVIITKQFKIELQIHDLPKFPSQDLQTDCELLNAQLEQFIEQDPSGYMWSHRRFKNQPDNSNPYEDII